MKKVNLIDVRTAFEYNQGSVPNAINVPLNEVAKRIGELKSLQPMIIFCAAGVRSQKAIDFLKANGINNICLLYTSPSPRDRLLSRMPSSA